MKVCGNCGVEVIACNLAGTEFVHVPTGWMTNCDEADPNGTKLKGTAVTPEQMAETDILPQVGETIEHAGKTYECVEVRWDREEDCIDVEYRRKFHEAGDPLPDRFQGQHPSLTVVDEATHWLNRNPS